MRWGCVALVIAGLFAGTVSAAHAAGAPPAGYDPCKENTTGPSLQEVVACDGRTLVEQDKALKGAYARLYSVFTDYQRERLRAAERAWARFRDADCASAGAQVDGGPGVPIGYIGMDQVQYKADCLLQVTHERVVVLKERYTLAVEYGAKERRKQWDADKRRSPKKP